MPVTLGGARARWHTPCSVMPVWLTPLLGPGPAPSIHSECSGLVHWGDDLRLRLTLVVGQQFFASSAVFSSSQGNGWQGRPGAPYCSLY